MRAILLIFLLFLSACSSLPPNELYRSSVQTNKEKRLIEYQGFSGIWLDELPNGKNPPASAYVNGVTIRRIGLNSVADLIDVFAEATDQQIIQPFDKMRTIEKRHYKIKFSGSINSKLDSASVYLSIHF